MLEITVVDPWIEAVSELREELLDRIRHHIPWDIVDLTFVGTLTELPSADSLRQVSHPREAPILRQWSEDEDNVLDEDLQATLNRIRNVEG